MKKLGFVMTIFFLLTLFAYGEAPPPIPEIKIPENIQQQEQKPKEEKPKEKTLPEGLEFPPQVKLKIPPPKNEEEAFKRIEDYKLLIKIIPPGTSKESIKEQVFGEYKDLVEPYLEDEEETSEEPKTESTDHAKVEEQEVEQDQVETTQPEFKLHQKHAHHKLQKTSSPSKLKTEKNLPQTTHKLQKTTKKEIKQTENSEETSFIKGSILFVLILIISAGIAYFLKQMKEE
jgi:hypothetical protein